ncbi:tyrosine-type recombinase/integrase [[Anoxybacillus] calidus]|uniref:hypothetical protein n=1 Tax=[Anoxybacillus] calidus TaxID=575178 RepID=UPI0015EBC1D6
MKYFIPSFGHIRVKDISRHQYQNFINELLKTRKESTVKYFHNTFNLGHESISITADTYTPITKKMKKESRKRFSEYMSNHI